MDRAAQDRLVLVIEDDRPLLLAMARAFTNAGAQVILAADGAEGLKRFMTSSPDLVVTDIIMPEREGIETILAMKAARPGVPILAVSGGGQTPPENSSPWPRVSAPTLCSRNLSAPGSFSTPPAS